MDSRLPLDESSSSGTDRTRSQSQLDDDNNDDSRTFIILPGSTSGPPTLLTIDEVQKAIKTAGDMQLAHEIAINPNFRLKPYNPPDSSLENRIKLIMHDAFWDVLRDELNSNPPKYDHAIALLDDIKENFTHIIPAKNQNALIRIHDVLDEKVIRQQAEQGIIDVNAYLTFIIQWMAKLCAPIRDDDVNKLNDNDDIVLTFRCIFEVMDLMKLDMANFLLDSVRQEIIAFSVEYEKQKFYEFIKVYPGGFPATSAWLSRNKCSDSSDRQAKAAAMINAYMEFLDWNPKHKYPEIMSMDQERMHELAAQALRLSCIASLMAIVSSFPIIQQTSDRQELLKHVTILFDDVSHQQDVAKTIGNVWLQVKSMIQSKFQENRQMMNNGAEKMLKNQILSLGNRDDAVRKLMWTRFIAFVRLVKTGHKMPLPPPGYEDLNCELQTLANTFKRLTAYNYSVFGEYYEKILNELSNSTEPESQSMNSNSSSK